MEAGQKKTMANFFGKEGFIRKTKDKMGAIKSCCSRPIDDKLMVTKMDLSHCGCLDVPHIVFNAERCIETLILASNQISSLPPQLFHCQEMKHLNLNDNCLNSIPPAIGSFLHLVSLKLDKNNLQELPENLKMCKKLKRLSLSNNPWKQVPNIVTQLINLEELYMNDCELNYLPASVGRLSKLKIIELRNNNLCNLPLSMARLELLTRLDISDNEFNEFPPFIPKLKSLRELLLDNNDIEEIIDIKNLVHLEHLDASYNHIIKVSETIGCCVHLNMLNLSFNYIEQLPNSIGNVSYLQTLQLEMNELSEIPKSIGKLSHLEELNLCNNKLYSLPSTIGLLRNLRNLNVSRNIIEEFPPEIGSCSKLGIINAAYNRLRVLPSEIGYLNNLKVLDLVGNFLMYLPITIINLRGVRAIWLSANQNIPLIPFTEDLNIASGERFLTNVALPQLGEIPSCKADGLDIKVVNNEKANLWCKKISFAEDDDILPGKLHRTPTPFPKELRAPNRKHHKNEEPKRNDNYVNIIDGKVSEQETPLLSPASVSVVSSGNGTSASEGCAVQIREANIRRSNKDVSLEMISQKVNDVTYVQSDYSLNDREIRNCTAGDGESNISVHKRMDTPVLKENSSLEPSVARNCNLKLSHSETAMPVCSPSFSLRMTNSVTNEDFGYNPNKFGSPFKLNSSVDKENLLNHSEYFDRQQVIYSNLVNDNESRRDTTNEIDSEENKSGMNAQAMREMFHNDIIYGCCKNVEFRGAHYLRGERDDRVSESVPKDLYSNNQPYKEKSFAQAPFSANKEVCTTLGPGPPPPPPPPLSSTSDDFTVKYKADDCSTPIQANESFSSECQQPLSKQDFISIAEQMKNRNIAPPCYEIAKLYSTKAALFENKRVDQLKSN